MDRCLFRSENLLHANDQPHWSYTRTIVCVVSAFIFGALLEFALVNYHGSTEFHRKEKRKRMKDQTMNMFMSSTAVHFKDPQLASVPPIISDNTFANFRQSASQLSCAQCNTEAEFSSQYQQQQPFLPPYMPEVCLFAKICFTNNIIWMWN